MRWQGLSRLPEWPCPLVQTPRANGHSWIECDLPKEKDSSNLAEEVGIAARAAGRRPGHVLLKKRNVMDCQMLVRCRELEMSFIARKRRARFRIAFRWLAILALAATSSAQQEQKDLSQVSLEELSNIQVYSASKHMQSASDAPASVTVVTADEIQKYGYRNLADILRSVPGFYVTYDRDYTFVGVRGFGRLGDWNSRILVLIDGHRINDNVLGNAMLGTEFLVDVDMIDRVEIVRGPSSSLYGAQAFFAVINVITRKGAQKRSLELSFAGASFGTYRGRASYSRRFRGI